MRNKDEQKIISYAFKLAKTLGNSYSKIYLFYSILRYYDKLKEKNKVSACFNDIVKSVKEIKDVDNKIYALFYLIDASVHIGKKKEAKKFLSEAYKLIQKLAGKVKKSYKENLHLSFFLDDIAKRYANISQYDRAIQIAKKRKDNICLLGDIARVMAKNGAHGRALNLAEKIAKYADLSKEDRFLRQILGEDSDKDHILSEIAKGYAQAGQLSRAFKIRKAITDSSYKIEPNMYIALRYIERGRIKDAYKLLSEALELIIKKEFPYLGVQVLLFIMEQDREVKQRRIKARILSKLVEEIKKRLVKLAKPGADKYNEREDLLCTLGHVYMDLGKQRAAKAMLSPRSYRSDLASKYINAGRYELAVKTMPDSDTWGTVWAVGEILSRCAQIQPLSYWLGSD